MTDKHRQNRQFRIAIIGSRDEILCFKAFGVDIIPVKNTDQALKKLIQIKKSQQGDSDIQKETYAIIFVMEDIIRTIPPDELKKLSAGALPAIISLPGHKGASGFGDTKIRRLVEKAVGSDIFGN